eukprot:CAMPEP_0117677100 /NCGR_PEP_ID=MMETSP0804-20121206/16561_1 /TAXON_ID=1074897 /ORGANISM="Tetraselmis astigmatica, Strain CCMP880" /LENGTH=195 /DNA_ID=CAMNT_0005486353 /DNA_START=72 /DNA_END=656 /DNA_ORIENTATION=+
MTFKLKTFGAPLVIFGYRYLGVEPAGAQAQQGFGLSVSLVMLTCLFVYSKILKLGQTDKTVTVKNRTLQGEVEEVKTFKQHDIDELTKMVKQTLIGAAVVLGLFMWKGYTQPLVFQALLLPMTALDHQLFHIYILGRPATGDLERPWKEESLLSALQSRAEEPAEGSEQPAAVEGSESESSSKLSKKEKKEAKKQ